MVLCDTGVSNTAPAASACDKEETSRDESSSTIGSESSNDGESRDGLNENSDDANDDQSSKLESKANASSRKVSENVEEDWEDDWETWNGWKWEEWEEWYKDTPCKPRIYHPDIKRLINCNGKHNRVELDIFDDDDCAALKNIWEEHRDNLDCPKRDRKPQLTEKQRKTYHGLVYKVIQRCADAYGEPLMLDQATISATTGVGHKRHADNMIFSVWYGGKSATGPDQELEFSRLNGAEVWWRPNKTNHRNFACSINLEDPSGWEGGEVKFYHWLPQVEPDAVYKAQKGCGVAFCGCDKNIHEVTPVTSGFRLCLLVWTRPANRECPERSQTTHYRRPGTGEAVWLTLAELTEEERARVAYPSRLSDVPAGSSNVSSEGVN